MQRRIKNLRDAVNLVADGEIERITVNITDEESDRIWVNRKADNGRQAVCWGRELENVGPELRDLVLQLLKGRLAFAEQEYAKI